MTVTDHPAELQLLALVEGELSPGEAGVLAEHVAGCAACRAAVEAQRGARALLRAAPPVAPLTSQQVGDLVWALPSHARPLPRWRRRPTLAWPARPIFVLAPVGAAAVAVVLAITLSGGSGRAPAPETLAAPPAAAAAAAAKALPPADASPLLRRVRGPVAQVVAFLKARGIAVLVEEGRLVVRTADAERVRQALVGRPAGPVEVIAR